MWYNTYKRELPWRETTDPYKIWLSEIILQQTRVSQGLPYYQRFVEHFENIEDLAAANEQDVLRFWQGLGYYSRARNLHKCAKIIADDFDGNFPIGYKNLLKLPGIGKYTAAAIASFAYREKVAAIDGNVYRVLSRVFGIQEDISSGSGQKVFEKLANELISEDQPDIFNQAMMEFGALQCTPKSPECETCPFALECYARKENMQAVLPVKKAKVKVKHRYFHYVVLKDGDQLALSSRDEQDIWKGLFDFWLLEGEEFREFDDLMGSNKYLAGISPYINSVEISDVYKHVLTHRRIFAKFYTLDLKKDAAAKLIAEALGLEFFDKEAISELPKPVLVSRYLNDIIF